MTTSDMSSKWFVDVHPAIFQNIVDKTPDAILLTDSNHQIVYSNTAFNRLLSRSPIGRSLKSIWHEDDLHLPDTFADWAKSSSYFSAYRVNGFHQIVDHFPNIQIVDTVSADWVRSKGRQVAEELLAIHAPGMLDVIWAASSDMALGAVEAVEAAGREHDVKVFSNDLTPESADYIRDGRLIAETHHGFAEWGWYGTQLAVQLALGQTVPATFNIRPRTAWRENVDAFYPDPHLKPIDWEAIRAGQDIPDKIRIGWIQDLSGPFRTATHYFEKAAADARAYGIPVELITRIPEDFMNLDHQASIIDDFVQQQVDVLILSTVPVDVIRDALQKAHSHGIPIMVVNQLEPIDGVEVATYIGFDNTEAGEISGYAVADYLRGSEIENRESDVDMDLAHWRSCFADFDPQTSNIAGRVAIIEGVAGSWSGECRLVHANGDIIPVDLTAFPMFSDMGEFTGVVMSIRDARERKRTEEALGVSEERYRHVSEIMSDVAFSQVYDPEQDRFVPEWVAGSLEDVTGYTKDEFYETIGPQKIYHPDDYPRLMADTATTIRGESTEGVYRLYTKSGDIRWRYIRRVPEWDAEHKQVVRYYGVTQDITERKRSELALQQKYEEVQEFQRLLTILHEINVELTSIDDLDEFYKQVVRLGLDRLQFDRLGLWLYDTIQNVAVGTYGTDDQGKIQSESHFSFGLTPGDGMWQAMQKPDRFIYEELSTLEHNLDVVGTGWKVTIGLRHGNRNLGWLSIDNLIHNQPITQPQLETLAHYGLLVSALLSRKQVEMRQLESERMLANVLDTIPVRVFWKDRNLRMVGCNRPFAEDGGFSSADELTGTIGEELFLENRIHLTEQELAQYRVDDLRVIETGTELLNYEEPQTRPDGKVHWIRTSKVPLRDGVGNIIGLLGAYEDITDQKRADEALKESEEWFRNISDLVTAAFSWKCDEEADEWFIEKIIGSLVTDRSNDVPTDQQSLSKRTHPDDYPRMLADIKATIAGETTDGEYRVTDTNGDIHWVHIKRKPQWNDQKTKVIRYFAAIEDITERKRAQDALETSEERLRQAVQAGNIGIFDHDHLTNTMYWSPEQRKIYGWGPDEEVDLDKFVEQSFFPEDREHILEAVRRAHDPSGDGLYNLEHRVMNRQGETRWLLNCALTFFEGEGSNRRPVRTIGAVMDVTERRQAVAALRESEERYMLAINGANDGIWDWNIVTDEMYLSPRWNALLGYDDGELPNTPAAFYALIHPEDQERVRDGISRYLESADSQDFYSDEIRIRHKDGDYRWMLDRGQAIYDSNGRPVRMAGSIKDFTERKRQEEALRDSENRLSVIFNQSTDVQILYEVDPDRTFPSLAVNKAFLDRSSTFEGEVDESLYFGKTHREIFPSEFVSEEIFAENLENLMKVADTGSPVRYEQTAVGPNTTLYVEISLTPIFDPPGMCRYILFSIRDITERKRAEHEIQKLNADLEQRVLQRTQQLEAVNRELEAFAYSVSHDLRAPLRSIDGFSQILLEDYADELGSEGLGILRRVRLATQRMAQLIDDMLQLSRITRHEIQPYTVDLSSLVEQISVELQATAPDRDVTFQIASSACVVGDKRLLNIMLENLIRNAWKFTGKKEHAHIIFGYEDQNDQQVFFVKDNGAGFDTTYVNKLFTPFQRLHSASEFEGTGVGLAIVQRIIQRHGGRVWAEGAVDAGATFYFTVSELL